MDRRGEVSDGAGDGRVTSGELNGDGITWLNLRELRLGDVGDESDILKRRDGEKIVSLADPVTGDRGMRFTTPSTGRLQSFLDPILPGEGDRPLGIGALLGSARRRSISSAPVSSAMLSRAMMLATVWPARTWSPSFTLTAVTVPGKGARIVSSRMVSVEPGAVTSSGRVCSRTWET